MKRCALCKELVSKLYTVNFSDPHEDEEGRVWGGNITPLDVCSECVSEEIADYILDKEEKPMITKFERALAVWTFGIFGLERGLKILKILYRIYYSCIYYPQIYWLKLGNTYRRIYLWFLHRQLKFYKVIIEARRYRGG